MPETTAIFIITFKLTADYHNFRFITLFLQSIITKYTNQSQKPINFSEMENSAIIKANGSLAISIECWGRFISRRQSINTGDINNHINHVTAKFVALHIHRRCVRCNVNFTWNKIFSNGASSLNYLRATNYIESRKGTLDSSFNHFNLLTTSNRKALSIHELEMKIFKRFSKVGSCGISFWTTLENASNMEWS